MRPDEFGAKNAEPQFKHQEFADSVANEMLCNCSLHQRIEVLHRIKEHLMMSNMQRLKELEEEIQSIKEAHSSLQSINR